MSHETVAPQNSTERLGAFLFPLRGIPGILFLLVLLLGVGTKQGETIWNWSLGLILLLWGEWMRVYSRRFIGRSSSTRTAKVSHLVTGGPYRYVRNPIYLGNLGILAGFSVISGLWWTLPVFLPTVLILYILIASYENRIVVTRYPEEGIAFSQAVPAWLPRLSPAPIEDSDRVAWKEVFRREGNTLFGIGIALTFLLVRELGWIPTSFLNF